MFSSILGDAVLTDHYPYDIIDSFGLITRGNFHMKQIDIRKSGLLEKGRTDRAAHLIINIPPSRRIQKYLNSHLCNIRPGKNASVPAITMPPTYKLIMAARCALISPRRAAK